MKILKIIALSKFTTGLTTAFFLFSFYFSTNAQTSNITTSFNLDKGALEISFDLSGPENSNWDIKVALVQKKDSKVIEIPPSNINKSLRGLNPGKQMFEISFADLQIEGDFSTKLDAQSSGSSPSRRQTSSVAAPVTKPAENSTPAIEQEQAIVEEDGAKMYTKKSKKRKVQTDEAEDETVPKTESIAPIITEQPVTKKGQDTLPSKTTITSSTDDYIPENNMPTKTNTVATVNKTANRVIKGFAVKGTSISDLSQKIKQASSELMVLSDLTPVNLNLDLKKLTFKCDFVSNNSNISKMGLYFGPKSSGCESCINVVISNPGSTVLLKGSNGTFDYELIGIKRN